jgi:thiamine-monophosphate kinase
MKRICDRFHVQIIGGDTNSTPGPLVINVTAVGVLEDDDQPWLLSGAQVGDAILVSGVLGGSLFGRHLGFDPRCDLAMYLADNYFVHAATDISDGLIIDLAKICSASGVGATLDLNQVPVSEAARAHSADSQAALQRALYDGEDYELIIVSSPNQVAQMVEDLNLPTRLTAIGRITARLGIYGLEGDGREHELEIRGYEHGVST